MKYVMDTNVYIEIDRRNHNIIKQINVVREQGEIYLTCFNYAEIYFGYLYSNEKKRDTALDKYVILNTTLNSAKIMAELKLELQKKGRKIPIMDLIIASIAIDNDMTLITMDNHFKDIKGLNVIILK